MDWSKAAELVGKTAPLLGSLIGGPAGGTVGALVSHALGVENTPEAISGAIESNPNETYLKLKELEHTERYRLREIQLQILQAEIFDKQQARTIHQHSRMPSVIACGLSLMVALGGGLLFTMHIPEANQDITYLVFGSLLTQWSAALAYWVGTTRSSAEKTRLIKS